MPLVFIAVGLAFIFTGVKGNTSQLWTLVQGDFTGTNNYIYWLSSILTLGAIGYIPQLQKLSRLFMVLILIVLLLDAKQTGTAAGVTVLQQIQAFIKSTTGQAGGQQS